MKEVVLGWFIVAAVATTITSLFWWIKCDSQSSRLKWALGELNADNEDLAKSLEVQKMAHSIRATWYKEFVVPAINAIKKAVSEGKLAPAVQAYEFLGALLPLWTNEGPSLKFLESVIYLQKPGSAKFDVSYVKDESQLVMIFKMWATENTEEPFKVTREFDLPL